MTNQADQPERKKERSRAGKLASIASTILWVLGFGLAFVIPSSSPWIWLPDALLLWGFWPLLWIWKAGWPWLVFGVLNVVIGLILLVMQYFNDEILQKFTREMLLMRAHLVHQHSYWDWILIGLVSCLVGIVRMAGTVIRWFLKRAKDKS